MLVIVITKHKQQCPNEWEKIYGRWRAGDFHNDFYAYFYRALNGWSQPSVLHKPAANPTHGASGLAHGGRSLVVLRTGGWVPLSSQAPSTPTYPSSQWTSGSVQFVAAPRGAASAESPAQLLPGLHHWNILQYPSHSLQVGYIFKLSFTTTELQTSYIHLLELFFCCSANCYVFFRTMKLRSGYNYRNPSYP